MSDKKNSSNRQIELLVLYSGMYMYNQPAVNGSVQSVSRVQIINSYCRIYMCSYSIDADAVIYIAGVPFTTYAGYQLACMLNSTLSSGH